MKALQIKNYILSRIEESGYTNFGSFEIIKDGDLLAISWDDEDCDGNIDPHCEWVNDEMIASAINQAEEEAPFEVSEAFLYGVIQILTLGDWMWD